MCIFMVFFISIAEIAWNEPNKYRWIHTLLTWQKFEFPYLNKIWNNPFGAIHFVELREAKISAFTASFINLIENKSQNYFLF